MVILLLNYSVAQQNVILIVLKTILYLAGRYLTFYIYA